MVQDGKKMSIAALIVAAGRGTRAGGNDPKQWQMLAGKRVIDHTLNAFKQASQYRYNPRGAASRRSK
jgi:2-C-methyl-D-erythritol 4-phosphate cytidylyltransferase